MCGLAAATPWSPVEIVTEALAEAGRRGPHQHGVAVLTGSGRWIVHKASGPLTPAVRIDGLPWMFYEALIAHSRLATSDRSPGDAPDLSGAQPFTNGEKVVAHNGTLRSVLVPDSLEFMRSAPLDVLADLADGPQAVIVARGPEITVYPWGQPLWLARGEEMGHPWAVVCSRRITASTKLPAGKPVVL